MAPPNHLNVGLDILLDPDILKRYQVPCQPRILVVTDGDLNFRDDSAFGLWRFLYGITQDSGVTNKPALTLGHRNVHSPAPIAIGSDTYTVQTPFNFATASPAVSGTNYDQIWLFGINANGTLTNPEIAAIAEFMNSGGGVFATGDHGKLGQELSGALPRIRHMREWEKIPMGTEDSDIVTVDIEENDRVHAVFRIDTVVDPGVNGLYEFDDQTDNVPQRIYPNYNVVPAAGADRWKATVHPLLMLPGAVATRTGSVGADGFRQDIDVLPDHPHESVCYAVTKETNPKAFTEPYTLGGLNFEEFPPAVASGKRLGSDIVAYAVSGGRSVFNGYWKPPVRPQMFGVISSYDGRLAQPYPGKGSVLEELFVTQPGIILSTST